MIEFVEGTSGTLEGQIETVLFRKERNGFTVADFVLPDARRLKVVGPLADVHAQPGIPLILSGSFERDERFGLQFKIDGTFDPQVTAEVAQAYLASGLIPNIGPAVAAEIVAAYGADTLRTLATDPDSLLSFRGITPGRLPAIKRALRDTLRLAPVVGLLRPFGVSLRISKRVLRRYGPSASELISANPWRLANEITGVGFATADRIAVGLGAPLESPARIEAAVLQALRDAAANGGHIVVPATVLEAETVTMCGRRNAEAREAIERLVETEEIVRVEHPEGYALPRLAESERMIAAKLRVIASFADADPVTIADADIDEVERNENAAFAAFSGLSDTNPGAVASPSDHDTTEEGPEGAPRFVFDASQRRAIKRALEDRITIITGAPGTGKTTIIRAVLDLADKHNLTSALCSPTGRAAKRLSEATGREAATIHRFLRYHPDHGFQGPDLLPDLLVVDEVSMLDSPLAARLIGALPPFVRLLLVGDEDQLPAVGPGNVLGDLLSAPSVNVLRLTTIHRTAEGSGVPALAGQIRDGVRKPHYDGRTTRFVPRGNDATMSSEEQAQEIAGWVATTAEKYRDRIDEFQILCPMKKGPAGTDALNRTVQAIVNPGPHAKFIRRDGFSLFPGDRVLVTSNDYANDLFNGDVGILLDITTDGDLVVRFDGVERTLPPDAGGGMTLAYAMTVHKAQGSEFPIVIIPMHTSAYLLLERRLFYTAVSRARQTVAIVGQPKAVAIAIGRHDPHSRRTMLREFMSAEVAPEAPLVALDAPDDELF